MQNLETGDLIVTAPGGLRKVIGKFITDQLRVQDLEAQLDGHSEDIETLTELVVLKQRQKGAEDILTLLFGEEGFLNVLNGKSPTP